MKRTFITAACAGVALLSGGTALALPVQQPDNRVDIAGRWPAQPGLGNIPIANDIQENQGGDIVALICGSTSADGRNRTRQVDNNGGQATACNLPRGQQIVIVDNR